jgi:methylmalonyl-CoA mutase cobalamin-binding domain/chain
MEKENKLTEIGTALAGLNEDTVEELLNQYLSEKIPPHKIIEDMTSGMDEVGRLFKEGEYFLSELIFAGEIFKAAMEKIKPLLNDEKPNKAKGKIVMGTAQGDIHDLGKNIVITLLECSGFEVIDVGVDASPDKFIEAIKISDATLVGMSALLTTTYESMASTINEISQAGLREKVKIMVGGGVVDEKIKIQIGADFYGKHAAEAVEIAKKVCVH